MTSRERVIAALNHQEGDKVPIDFGGTGSSGITAIAYNKLRKYLKLPGQNAKLYDLMQQIVEPELDILEIVKSDVMPLYRLAPRFNIPVDRWKTWNLKDGSECLVPEKYNPVENDKGDYEITEEGKAIARMPRDGYYFDIAYHPHSFIEEIADIKKIKFPEISMYELEFLARNAKRLYEDTEYAIVGAFGGSLFETGQRMFGYEKFLMDLVLNKDVIHAWLDKLTANHLINLEKYLETVGKYINVIQFSDDLGTQNSLILSPGIYREMIKPYHAKIYQFVQQNFPHVKVLLHSCGAIFDLIPDLLEVGVQALNPVQISATGMEPSRLKKEFGRDIVFWGGGANMQHTVNNGTLEEIESEVKRLMSIFKTGGGFVFTQVHNIQENVSPDRIVTIYKTADEYRNY